MKKEVANLETRFSVAGLGEVRSKVAQMSADVSRTLARTTIKAPLGGLVASAKAATLALRTTARAASGLAKTVAGVGGIGSLVGAGGQLFAVREALRDTQTYIQGLETVAATLGMPIDELSKFANTAEHYGLELEDIRQAMTQFYGIAGEAAEGNNEYARTFKRLGLDMSSAGNQALNMTNLFKKFAAQAGKLEGSQLTAALTQIFGDDDATKISRLVQAMSKAGAVRNPLSTPGNYTAEYLAMMAEARKDPAQERRDRLEKESGAIVGKDDLALSQRMKQATTELSQAFRGLQMTIFRAFGPGVTDLILVGAAAIRKYRVEITVYLYRGFQRLTQLVHDFVVIFFDQSPVIAIKNNWLRTLKQVLETMWSLAVQAGRLIYIIATLANAFVLDRTGMGIIENLERITAESIVSALQRLGQWLAGITQLAKEFFWVLTGQDQNITTGFGVALMAWRDAIISTIVGVYNAVMPYIVGVRDAIVSLFSGFAAGSIDVTANAFYNLGATISIVMGYLSAFAQAFYGVFILQQDAIGNFAWLNVVRDWIVNLWSHLQIAIGWFQALFGALESFFAYFGIDLRSTLLFLGLLRLIGAGGLIAWVSKGFLGLVGTLLKKVFPAFGSKVAVHAFGTVVELIMTMARDLVKFLGWAGGAGIKGMATAIAAGTGHIVSAFASMFAAGGPVIAAMAAGGVILGIALASALQDTFVSRFIQGITNWFMGVDKSIDDAGRAIRENYEQGSSGALSGQRGKTTFVPPVAAYPGAAIMDANAGFVGTSGFSDGNARVPESEHLGDVNINIGDETYPAKMPRDVFADIKRNQDNSPTGGLL